MSSDLPNRITIIFKNEEQEFSLIDTRKHLIENFTYFHSRLQKPFLEYDQDIIYVLLEKETMDSIEFNIWKEWFLGNIEFKDIPFQQLPYFYVILDYFSEDKHIKDLKTFIYDSLCNYLNTECNKDNVNLLIQLIGFCVDLKIELNGLVISYELIKKDTDILLKCMDSFYNMLKEKEENPIATIYLLDIIGNSCAGLKDDILKYILIDPFNEILDLNYIEIKNKIQGIKLDKILCNRETFLNNLEPILTLLNNKEDNFYIWNRDTTVKVILAGGSVINALRNVKSEGMDYDFLFMEKIH